MNLKEAVTSLENHLGLKEPLAPDPSGAYIVVFDDRLETELFEKEEGLLFFKSTLAILPDNSNAQETLLKKYLKMNLARIKSNDDFLAIDPSTEYLCIYRRISSTYLKPDAFIEKFESFVNNLEFWEDFSQDNPGNHAPATPFIIHP